MNKQILFLDTINATNSANDAYNNCSIPINNPFRNVKRVSLKSIEMPLFITSVRSGNTSNVIYLQFTYSTWTNQQVEIVITSGSYTLASLITELNSKLASSLTPYAGLNFTVRTSFTLGKWIIYFESSNAPYFSFWKDSVLLSNILGFTTSDFLPPTMSFPRTMESKLPFNLSPDNYLNFHITNLPSVSSNASGILSTFKIPLPVLQGQVLYLSDNSLFYQFVNISSAGFVMDKVIIKITDRWGYDISGLNAHISFSLLVEYDNI